MSDPRPPSDAGYRSYSRPMDDEFLRRARRITKGMGVPDATFGLPTSWWRRWWQRHVTRR